MISIVTPSYNQLDWLRLAMASVADQKNVEVEHIVQDGGSDPEALASLLKTPIGQIFSEPDSGMYDAINRGLRKARGAICGYLNCDEQYLPGTLAKAAKFLDTHPEVDVLFGDAILVTEEGRPISYRRTILPTKRHIRLSHLNTTTCATFFRQRLLDKGFYFDPAWKTVGDAAWIETLLDHGVKMATIRCPLAVFTITGKNLGDSPTSRSEIEQRRGSIDRGTGLERAAAVSWHRFRKALAGAYCRRNVEIDIYTLRSPEERQHLAARNVGFGWPRSTEMKGWA